MFNDLPDLPDHTDTGHEEPTPDPVPELPDTDPNNVGTNEDTGNSVSLWPAGRHYDNGTWDEVIPK